MGSAKDRKMAVEIELKARVEDPEERKRIISQFAGSGEEFLKEDSYWYPPSGPGGSSSRPELPGAPGLPSGVRIRREERRKGPEGGGDSLSTRICFKTKEKREGIEINDERECEVSDPMVFEELLVRLGLRPGPRKRKRGWAWVYRGITIELCKVSGSASPGKDGETVRLGWFAELEILADQDREDTTAAARTRLLELLKKMGINEDRIEERYYTELLREAENASLPSG
jgi:adenylate cyclase class 2